MNIILFNHLMLSSSFFLQYGYYTRKRAIIVALKEQTSVAVHDIAHSIGVSKSSVARLRKTHSETRFVSPG